MGQEFELDESAALRLLESLHDGGLFVALYDHDDILRYANKSFRSAFARNITGSIDFSTLVRINHANGTGADIGAVGIDTYILRARTRRRSRPYCAFQLDLTDGRRLWLTETLLPDGWLFCVATDITTLKQTEAALRTARDVALQASQTDYLTRLPNRRYGFQFLKRSLNTALARGEPLSIALIDLDHFKDINDKFGHEAGDAALRKFADTCRAKLRATDVVARVGGEEFMIVWSSTALSNALDVLHRIHDEPIQVSLPADETGFTYTFSAGITEVSSGDSMRSLLIRADSAVYAAKANGRNAIRVARE